MRFYFRETADGRYVGTTTANEEEATARAGHFCEAVPQHAPRLHYLVTGTWNGDEHFHFRAVTHEQIRERAQAALDAEHALAVVAPPSKLAAAHARATSAESLVASLHAQLADASPRSAAQEAQEAFEARFPALRGGS